jgi:TolB-like protein/Flp pilus assembly protein TadD
MHLHAAENKGYALTMPIAESEVQSARRQLEQVLASAGFSSNERLARFLRFVVEEHLQGRDGDIKESVIAVEVFGRRPDHDPKQDSIVRTEAARLRARLAEYYLGEGKDDVLVIELPKGGYAPVLRQTAVEPRTPPVGPKGNLPRSGTRLRHWMAVAGVLLAVGAAGAWLWLNRQSAPIPIAVLPLVNLSQDPANDYFADGLTDEIIRNLSIIEGLAVRSQTSSFAFKGKPQNVREAGKQLAADYILEGSVLRAGQQLRINAQLIRVRDDFPLWSHRFDLELTDVFAIQDEISRGIVNQLRLKLGAGRRRYETSTEAYDLYLRARAQELQRGFLGLSDSAEAFEQVIAKDASFAPAYAGLAAAHAARSGQFRYDFAAEVSKMRAAAEKAIVLDPLLAEAHDALGMICARDAQWDQSEQSFRRAIKIDPSRPESHGHFAMYLLLPLGRIEEALKQVRAAEKADPLSPEVQGWLAYVLISAGQYDEAASHCEKQPADFRNKPQCLGRARLGQGRTDEAIHILETAVNRSASAGSEAQGELGYAYARAGRRDDAERLAVSTSSINPYNRALIFAGLRDKDRTFQALELAAAGGPFRIGRALTFPEFAFLRGDPRVKVLRKKVGLPE